MPAISNRVILEKITHIEEILEWLQAKLKEEPSHLLSGKVEELKAIVTPSEEELKELKSVVSKKNGDSNERYA